MIPKSSVELLMTVEQCHPRVVRHEIKGEFLVFTHHDNEDFMTRPELDVQRRRCPMRVHL